MSQNTLQIGTNNLKFSESNVEGQFVTIDNEEFYVIRNNHKMDPFFMSIVSDSDHWMFISANGALTAGRKNPENALFPYYTVDKIQDSAEITGSKTIIKVKKDNKNYLWEPFSDRFSGVYQVARNIYKNITGNKIIFEEINEDLGLSFSYSWSNSNKYGFVKTSELKSNSGNIEAEILDGIQNILPYAVNRGLQNTMSSLVDAYKKCEVVPETGLGIFSLSSIPVDKAEPSESLKVNTVWAYAKEVKKYLLSSKQLDNFRKGLDVSSEQDIRGKRGAYFINFNTTLSGSSSAKWYIVAEVNQTASKVASLNNLLKSGKNLAELLVADVKTGTSNLTRIVACADGLQITNDKKLYYRQFSNVMFNVMRGGIFDNGYTVSKTDLLKYLNTTNRKVVQKFNNWLNELPAEINYYDLISKAESTKEAALIRLCLEYMPLTFSRRHGDPSRPWNLFSIETKNEAGEKILNYQGNWRDIFQNWEALAMSYPGYIESMISKFVNASTIDGYNPYRVTRDGFDWEIQDPHDPWSFIGYWGDHQVIYLLKLLELSAKYHPGRLESLLTSNVFTYANVPYRIKDYADILKNPYSTIDYDAELEEKIGKIVKETGSDGKVLYSKSGDIYFVNLSEKILVAMLAKITNLVPEGGIWMNTQRPEWNDANNALAGYGLSMVTLYYLRRYLQFCKNVYANLQNTEIQLSEEVATLISNVQEVFKQNKALLAGKINNKKRRQVMDALGKASEAYRKPVYKNGYSEKKSKTDAAKLVEFFTIALEFVDHSVKANKRSDNLYHAYNVLALKNDEAEIFNLYEMLEGQVSVLSSGALSTDEAIAVLEGLRKSKMYRPDQNSYMLYPDRQLPRFVDKNNIPNELLAKSALLQQLIKDNEISVVEKDENGVAHFNGAFANKNILEDALTIVASKGYQALVDKEKQLVLDIYEDMFNHKAFTGRSGTFFSYEGLGCIYWHMVSKLLVAAEEIYFKAHSENASASTLEKLNHIYYDIRSGLGMNKTPQVYGAFPTDPYSHTPGHSGAQQPGMTGQVKEDIITRFAELGIKVNKGVITFNKQLFNTAELLDKAIDFKYFDVAGAEKTISLAAGTMCFTYCQVPVIIKKGSEASVTVDYNDLSKVVKGLSLDNEISNSIFKREAKVKKIEVSIV